MDDRVAEALKHGGVMDITTTGRRTGLPRRIELVFHNIDGRILISGRPGFPRGWIANLKADPRFTFHLKRGIQRRSAGHRSGHHRSRGAGAAHPGHRRGLGLRPGDHGRFVAAR